MELKRILGRGLRGGEPRFSNCSLPRNWPPSRNRAPTLRPQVATGIQGQASQHALNVGPIRAIPHGFGITHKGEHSAPLVAER